MEIPGWAYVLVGVVVGGVSGYVYKFIPRDGKPNTAMALFFFIGMVFILIGVAKFFFKKVDKEEALAQQKAASTPMHELDRTEHINRVEQEMNKIYSQQNPQKAHPTRPQGHSSTYAQSHPYHGAQHQSTPHQPVHQTISHQTHQSIHPQQAHQSSIHQTPSTMHHAPHHMSQQISGVTCKKCGMANHANANYCHKCGNRMK